MLLASQMSSRQLADLSRRVGTMIAAGVDVRKVWAREVESGPLGFRRQMRIINDAVEAGEAVADGMQRTGRTFPPLFRDMVTVGEKTGRLPEVLKRLAVHYEHRDRMRRTFLNSLAWPMFQFFIAIVVVGLLIWIMGFLATRNGGKPIDLLGFGLVGTAGLVRYVSFLAVVACAFGALYWAFRRGVFWTRLLQRAALQLPAVGGCLQTLALARMAWAMHLTLDVEMDLRQSLPLVLRSTGNDHYLRHTESIVADVADGREIHEALARSGAFPSDFLATVAVGEESGQLVESMGHLSLQYEERARDAMSRLSQAASFGVWLLVAGMIVFLIFRLASFYLGTINDAVKGF